MTGMEGMALVFGGLSDGRDRMRSAMTHRGDRIQSTFVSDQAALYSTNPDMDQGELQVCFNGYLLDREAPYAAGIADMYREHGADFLDLLEGVFRVAVYDVEQETLLVATDKLGLRKLFYTDHGEGIGIAHGFAPLFGLTGEARIDEQGVQQFIISRHTYFYGEHTIAKGVRRMCPAHRLTIDSSGKRTSEIYWDVDRVQRQVSDAAATQRIEDLLHDAIDKVLDHCEQPPNVFLSGGLDSSFLAALLTEHADTVNTYVAGMRAEHYAPAQTVADHLGTNHRELSIPLELPSTRLLWDYDDPLVGWACFYPPTVHSAFHGENEFHGLLSILPFPHGTRYDKLERFTPLTPVFRIINWTGIDGWIDRRLETDIRKGTNTLLSDYAARGIVEEGGLPGIDMATVLQNRLRAYPFPDQVLDQYADISPERSQFAHRHYFSLKVEIPPQMAAYTEPCQYRCVYGYTPLLEFAYSLPAAQVDGRRLMKRIGQDRLPQRILQRPASKSGFWGREMFSRQIRENEDAFMDALDSLLDRGLLKESVVRRHARLKNLDRHPMYPWFMLRLYMLEQWFHAFLDTDQPWLPPGDGS